MSVIRNSVIGNLLLLVSSVLGKTAGILDGDYALIAPGSNVADGQIALLLIDDKI